MLETWLRESWVRLPATGQLCFCSLIFVDYVLILYDYQMAFSPICSVVYAPQSLSSRARFADPVRIPLRPCLPCPCLHHAVLLVIALFMSRHCTHTVKLHPHSVFVMLSGFLRHR